jgi:transcription-repair coupling factor (superfamily II helicase)
MNPLKKGARKIGVSGLKASSCPFLLSFLRQESSKSFLVVTPTLKKAEECYRELLFFLAEDSEPAYGNGKQKRIFLYPPGEEVPFENGSRDPDLTSRRVEVLHHLMRGNQTVIIVAPITALIRKVIPREILEKYSIPLKTGEEVDLEEIASLLHKSGYLKVALVEDRGDYSIRGGIVDVFPPGYPAPLRIEFYGDVVESIRQFDVVSQRSFGELKDAWIVPVSEAILEEENMHQIAERIAQQGKQMMIPSQKIGELTSSLSQFHVNADTECLLPCFYPGLDTVFDYLQEDSFIFLQDFGEIEGEQGNFLLSAEEQHEKCLEQEKFTPLPLQLYLSFEQITGVLNEFQTVYFSEVDFSLPGEEIISFETSSNDDIRKELIECTSSRGMLSPLVERIKNWQEEGSGILLICHSSNEAQNLIQLLEEYSVPVKLIESEYFDKESLLTYSQTVWVQVAGFDKGFRFPLLRVVVITEEEIFGEKRRRPIVSRAKRGYPVSDFSDLNADDFVVHRDHGVGIYRGLKGLEVGGDDSDYLLLEYLGGDKLYIPVDRLKLVQKYAGTDKYTPKIDRLGGTAWKKTKMKVEASVKAMAKELLEIYASRKLVKGISFSAIDHYYREFEATFPYEETPDQLAAIEDVMRDMNEAKPMDRLICGDVGYGKTEVALRSAFRAAMDGKQVAILVPTTVLAQQHYQTICERLKPYPIEVEMLSRFRTRAEQNKILERLKDGHVDIIIGTHRLIQKDVHFKNLALVVIDEEQRFGVAHKERLKKMRKQVDVLALTATPIPRTLYMSFMGIRDMSVINTPPEDRQSIKTYINRFDSNVVKEAIVRELRRGGQVFFVHDRVRSIPAMAKFLSELVPEAKLGVAHGQMSVRQLEKVMLAFIKKEVNLLLSTTIIESGLDFPSANTIVINRADRLGLAQLYQLRGRVGRSKQRAYCYLLTPGESAISKESKERLHAIFEFSELGSSFRLATRDLEIRGAGNVLGASQSGHIAAVGIDLYTQLMEESIRELKGEEVSPEIDPEVNLSVSAFIPDEYIKDVNQRLVVYKRLASCMQDREVEEIGEELSDRFGRLPVEVNNLLGVITFKNLLRRYLIASIDCNGSEIILTFHPHARDSLEKILALIESDPGRFRLSPELKLSVACEKRDWKEVMGEVKKLLQ